MPRVPHSTDDLEGADDALLAAFRAGDFIALEALLDEELSITGPSGEPHGKWEEIERYRSGGRRISAITVERRRVRVLEELGIVAATVIVEGTEGGAAFRSRERQTRTWRLAEGWTLVASHASPAG